MVWKLVGNTKKFLKSAVGWQGHGEPDSKDFPSSSPRRSSSEYDEQADNSASRKMVSKEVDPEGWSSETQSAENSGPRGTRSDTKKINTRASEGQNKSTIHTTSPEPTLALSHGLTDRTKGKSRSGTKDANDIARTSPNVRQNTIGYICAAYPKIREIVKANKIDCLLCYASTEIKRLSDITEKDGRKITTLKSEIKGKNDQIELMKKTDKDQKYQIGSMKKTLATKEGEVMNLNDTIQAQKHELDSLNRRYEKTRTDFQKNEMEIQKLQQTELAIKKQTDVLMDEKARSLIHDTIRTKIQTITRLYLRRIPWATILKTNNDETLLKIFDAGFSRAWQSKFWPLVRDHPNISTHTVVQALLSCTISKVFFEDPFFCCGGAVRDTLRIIYQSAIDKNSETAVVWRAKTVCLFNRILEEKDLAATQHNIIVEQIFGSVTKLIQMDYDLKENEKTDLLNKLVDLVQSSIKLAADWHSREFYFRCISAEWLHWKGLDVYSEEAAKYVTPFPASKKLEAKGAYNIVAVISPGFIRYLKGDGAGYEEIIWEKASVLLSESPPRQFSHIF
ncbi:hypothetical protein TWF281_001170 [Arthrobotrys megalospora]